MSDRYLMVETEDGTIMRVWRGFSKSEEELKKDAIRRYKDCLSKGIIIKSCGKISVDWEKYCALVQRRGGTDTVINVHNVLQEIGIISHSLDNSYIVISNGALIIGPNNGNSSLNFARKEDAEMWLKFSGYAGIVRHILID